MADARGSVAALSGMNITPLIDVMMVLLVIFMVTVPAVVGEIPFDLPRGDTKGVEPERIQLRISEAGELFWGNQPLPRSAWAATFALEAQRSPQPLIELDSDDEADYQQLVEVLAMAHDAGLTRVGLVDR